jgi:hypothetical protein
MYKHEGSEQRGAEWPRKVKKDLLRFDGVQIFLEKDLMFLLYNHG